MINDKMKIPTSSLCTATVIRVYNDTQSGLNLIDVKRDDNDMNIQGVSVLSMVVGPGYGTVYVPPVGQQVLLAILDERSQSAVCLGGLYNKTSKPPFKVDATNTKMYLKYGTGWTITLDSTPGKEQLEIETSKKDVLTVDQTKRLTTIKSADGQTKMELDFTKGSINMEALKEIKMTVAKNNSITIDAKGVTINGKPQANVNATIITMKAEGQFKAQGMQAVVKGTGSTLIG